MLTAPSLQPLPLGATAVLGLGVAMVTGVLPFAAAFSAFSSEIPWCARASLTAPFRRHATLHRLTGEPQQRTERQRYTLDDSSSGV